MQNFENFEIGDKVELTEGYYPHKTGTQGTVTHVKSDGLLTVKIANGSTFQAFAFRFKKVTEGEIKVGDTVTVERVTWTAFGNERKGYTLTGEVYGVDGALWVGPVSLGVHDVKVTDHIPAPEPKPQLPTRTLTIVAPGNQTDRSRAVLLSDGKWYFSGWISGFGETHPDEWGSGWRVVYDATEADA